MVLNAAICEVEENRLFHTFKLIVEFYFNTWELLVEVVYGWYCIKICTCRILAKDEDNIIWF